MDPQSNTAASNGGGSFVLGVARIALGVFIGGLAALFVHDAIVGPASAVPPPPPPVADTGTRPITQPPAAAPPAPEPAAPPQAPALPPPQPVAPPAPPPQQPPAEAPAQAPASAPDAAGSSAQPADGLQKAQALAARLEAERQQRRADAWARFFQPSPVCRADPATRPCADAHLAARKRFDAQYVDR